MRKFLLPVLILLLFTETKAQFAISLGPDLQTCAGTSVNLGSSLVTTGGTPPYAYAWSPATGLNSPTVANPTALLQTTTSFVLTVTDSTGLTATDSISIFVSPPLFIIDSTSNISCFGASDGWIDLVVTGGAPPYSYLWSNGSTTQFQNGLPAGTYGVSVVDGLGCTAYQNMTITEPTPITVFPSATDISASGICDGAIDLVISGGIAPYSYNWSNGDTGAHLNNLCAGTYIVTVTDWHGCTITAAVPVGGSCTGSNLAATITSQDIACTHLLDTLVVNITGGTPPYSNTWNNGVSGETLIVNQAGVYTAYITDSAGCSIAVADTVINTGLVVTMSNYAAASCNGMPDGFIKVNVTGGTPPYTYLWTTGGTTDSIGGLSSGSYSLTVDDAGQCDITFGFYLPQGSTNYSYYAYASSTDANCSNSGTASVSVYGGTAPFTYLWSNGDTTATISALTGGSYYTVTVTDSSGCSRSAATYVNTTCYNVIEGIVFNDINGNCVMDSGESTLSGISLTADNGSATFYGYSAFDGHYTIHTTATGNFTVTATYTGNNSCSSVNLCGAQSASFSSLGNTDTINFGFGASSGYDLALHPGWHTANPGFPKDYWVLYYQQSLPLYTGPAVITFRYDSILQFNSCNNNGAINMSNHTITWNVANVPHSWDWNTVPRAYFTVPANTPVGYQLKQEFWLTPTANDCDSSDNHMLFIQPISGSMDPNEKEVSPAGDIHEEDSVLTYTIHFQNTGNDTTWFVVVKDTLNAGLDPATVQNIASSHPYSSFDISDFGILTWTFNPIYLVDSFTNEAASKGFIIFRVKKKAGLPLNTQITNRASIYFDYNEPVMTNTVSNKLTSPDFVFNYISDANIKVAAVPNPFTQSTQITVEGVSGHYDFELLAISGQVVKKISSVNQDRFYLQREGLSNGVYFYRITTAQKQSAFGRLIIQ